MVINFCMGCIVVLAWLARLDQKLLCWCSDCNEDYELVCTTIRFQGSIYKFCMGSMVYCNRVHRGNILRHFQD